MAERPLSADESQLWARVMASVRPLRAVAASATKPVRSATVEAPGSSRPMVKATSGRKDEKRASRQLAQVAPLISRSTVMEATLDGGWDRRITRGAVTPDSTLDLHGHTLHSAHSMLDAGLERALSRGDRVLLLVTGKPPRAESERPHARGAIRAAVADWLAASRHAERIAAVRGAHPRHGGAGALYLVLRRPRTKS